MAAPAYRRDACRLCGSRNLEPVLKLTPTPPGDAYVSAGDREKVQEVFPLDLFLCVECGLLELLDVIDPRILYGNYIYATAHSLGLSDHFFGYVNEVIEYAKPPRGSLVVDIGSNDGTLLRIFQGCGMQVLGIDPASGVARKATESGVETIPAFFSPEIARQVKEERGLAAVVTANNVLANVDDLSSLIEGIRDLVAPEGIFVFETGYVLDLVHKMLIDNIYHEHLCYYSVKALDYCFRHHGLELVEVKRVPSKGGSLRGIAQQKGGPHRRSTSVGALLGSEESGAIHHPASYAKLAAKIDQSKEELWKVLRGLATGGNLIAGYGASVGVTTLIYHFDLGEVLTFIVDDNPTRHNLFSPGYHIPVVPSHVLYSQKPHYVLILAWRYYEAIIKKHQEYLTQGGRFALPLPMVQVMS
jgi:SAM-dependent methyltransferase